MSVGEPSTVAVDPLMELRGAPNSWLTIPRNSARNRSSSSTAVMPCRVTTNDSSTPSAERMGVAVTSAVTLRPSGTPMTISSARTVSFVPSARGSSRNEISRPSACRNVKQSRSCTGDWFGSRSLSTILLASLLSETAVSVLRLKTTTPTGEVSISVSMPAGIDDGHRRVGREHH